MSAPVLRWQLVTTDPDRLTAFYGDLFGWTASTDTALGDRQINAGERGIHGGVWPAPSGAHSFVQLFIGVPDVEQSVARALELGARVVVPVTALPDGDVMAILADPCGVTFGLMRHVTA